MYYQITANVMIQDNNGYQHTICCPIFYLNSNLQGITDSIHAENIAYSMLRLLVPVASIHITVQKVENE